MMEKTVPSEHLKGKFILQHGDCRQLTKEQVIKMILVKKPQQQKQVLVKFPCCEAQFLRSSTEQKFHDVCLYCFSQFNQTQLKQKVNTNQPAIAICYQCFFNLKTKDFLQQISTDSIQSLFIYLFYRCTCCSKIIESCNESKCIECLTEEQIHQSSDQACQGPQNQPPIGIYFNQCKSYRSIQSIKNFIPYLEPWSSSASSESEKQPLMKYDEPKMNEKIYGHFLFNRQNYGNKSQDQLIDQIRILSQRIYKMELLIQQRGVWKVGSKNININENMLKTYRSEVVVPELKKEIELNGVKLDEKCEVYEGKFMKQKREKGIETDSINNSQSSSKSEPKSSWVEIVAPSLPDSHQKATSKIDLGSEMCNKIEMNKLDEEQEKIKLKKMNNSTRTMQQRTSRIQEEEDEEMWRQGRESLLGNGRNSMTSTAPIGMKMRQSEEQ